MTSPELAIRAARAAFNRALADGDLSSIGPLLAANVVLVTGTDGAVLSGRKAQLQAWKREFGAASRTTYVRMPETVTVSAGRSLAFEQGRWEGTVPGSGERLASGTYGAKWRREEAGWIIEAELFVTLD